MDCGKTGRLLSILRHEKQLTQKQLADKMNISDKTVSKWERGLGCPDVSLLCELSAIFEIDIIKILSGDLSQNSSVGGNMKKTKYFVCQNCNSINLSTGEASVTCCSRKLEPLLPQKADDSIKLCIEPVEDEIYITSEHPMDKDNFISFVALAKGDSIKLYKQYPEWNLSLRIPKSDKGTLVWHSTTKGLFYQYI